MMESSGHSYEIVTRLEAAERQLFVAIRMFFERKDEMAVHTLAAAARDVLVVLGRPRSIKSLSRTTRPKDKKDIPIVKKTQNFFNTRREIQTMNVLPREDHVSSL